MNTYRVTVMVTLDVQAENSPDFCSLAAPELQVMPVRGKQQPSPPTVLPL